MRRSLLASLVPFLVGCGGHGSSGDPTPIPLTPYGDLRFNKATGYGGSTTSFGFVILDSSLTNGILTVGNTHETTETASRTVEIVLSGYSGGEGRSYEVADGEALLRLHEKGPDGEDRVWAATGGKVVDGGTDLHRRLLKIESTTISPVEGTGAVGTVRLDGRLHIGLFGG